MNNCSSHLIWNQLSFDYHGLNKIPTTKPYQISQPDSSLRFSAMQINGTRENFLRNINFARFTGFCRFFIFYSKVKLIEPQLGKLFQHFVYTGVKRNFLYYNIQRKAQYTVQSTIYNTVTYHLHYIVILAVRKMSYLKSKDAALLYPLNNNQHQDPEMFGRFPILMNFAVLHLDEVELCLQSPKGLIPIAKNFVCYKSRNHGLLDVSQIFASTPVDDTFKIGLENVDMSAMELSFATRNAQPSRYRLQNIQNAAAYIVTDILVNRSIKARVTCNAANRKISSLCEPVIGWNILSFRWFKNYGRPSVVFTGIKKLSFATCYSKNPLNFLMYSSPYDGSTWILTGASVVLMFLFLIFHNLISHVQVEPVYLLCYIYGTLLAQVPDLRSSSNSNGIRVLFACWLIVICILTNAYNGLMIMNLNAPFPPKYPLEFKVTYLLSHFNFHHVLWGT